MNGAASSPQADVFIVAAAQVKKCLDVTQMLGGENYVFWGGREGYQSLLNTDMGRELDHLARFFHMAQDYRRKIEFNATFLIEPKPQEPTKHQVGGRRRNDFVTLSTFQWIDSSLDRLLLLLLLPFPFPFGSTTGTPPRPSAFSASTA